MYEERTIARRAILADWIDRDAAPLEEKLIDVLGDLQVDFNEERHEEGDIICSAAYDERHDEDGDGAADSVDDFVYFENRNAVAHVCN